MSSLKRLLCWFVAVNVAHRPNAAAAEQLLGELLIANVAAYESSHPEGSHSPEWAIFLTFLAAAINWQHRRAVA